VGTISSAFGKLLLTESLIDPNFGEKIFLHEKKVYEDVLGPSAPHYGSLPKRSYIPTIVIPDETNFILNKVYILEMEGSISLGDVSISHHEMKENIKANILVKMDKYRSDAKITEKLKWMKNYIESSTLSLESESTSFTQLV